MTFAQLASAISNINIGVDLLGFSYFDVNNGDIISYEGYNYMIIAMQYSSSKYFTIWILNLKTYIGFAYGVSTSSGYPWTYYVVDNNTVTNSTTFFTRRSSHSNWYDVNVENIKNGTDNKTYLRHSVYNYEWYLYPYNKTIRNMSGASGRYINVLLY